MVDLTKYKSAPIIWHVNYYQIPVTVIPADEAGMVEFNEILDYHKSNPSFTRIKWTPSGGICTDRRFFFPPCWDVRASKTCVEIISLLASGMRRIQFRDPLKTGKGDVMAGGKAIRLFAKKLKQISGIDLTDYKVDNGLELREAFLAEGKSYLIKVNPLFVTETVCIEDASTYYPCHHIDFNSSFPSGLVNAYPEFTDTVDFFYNNRKKHAEYKGCMNSAIGKMWSEEYHNACYAPLSIAAIKDNNQRLEEMAKRLEDAGRIPLLFNVDGIWYLGEEYHGEGEGTQRGQWKNDHRNCKFRARTAGSYEYIEDGIYHPVVRGIPNERKAGWVWGDIFTPHKIYRYEYDANNMTVVKVEKEV